MSKNKIPLRRYASPLTHYPLPITHYPLPITHYPLPITHYPLPITHYPLPITHYPLPITHYPLPITHYPLPITHHQSHLRIHPPRIQNARRVHCLLHPPVQLHQHFRQRMEGGDIRLAAAEQRGMAVGLARGIADGRCVGVRLQ